MRAIEVQAPNKWGVKGHLSVFLAGSIEQGEAEDWQKEIISLLSDKPIEFLNPRRDNWDSSWKQEYGDNEFTKQVEWELTSLDAVDLIVCYFDKETKSPITMLELGLHAKSQKLIVCCPEGFYRKGNVDVVCNKYGVKQVEDLNELAKVLRLRSLISAS
tara:strand:- start:7345 stop:7821 length:477 start_codon:yes stop_codon:yes gene_type:complete